MKGFLQRLAANATRTAPRIHPLVDSMYAAPHVAEQAAPSLHFESTVQSVAPQPRMSQTKAPELPQDRTQSGRNLAAPHLANHPLNAFLGAEQNLVEPLVQHLIGKSTTDSSRGEEQSSPMAGSSEASHKSPTAMSLESSRSADQGEIRLRGLEYLPVVVERLLRADAPNAPDAASGRQQTESRVMQAQTPRKEPEPRTIAAQVNAHRQQAPVLQPSRPAQQQPEDIQIHIGRIEVLAVPQTSPRPAAAPVRKGLNLDEYLSRRNGRSG
jgi:hypothetical protein